MSGGAGDDVITGILGASPTYTVGDNINGGGGNDTLNLIDDDAAAFGLVSLSSVETVNVRLLSGAGQTELNAADWSGVATLTNASSLANATLDVSGLSDDTLVVLYGNTDINIGYNNTTTGATANAVLVNAGSAGTATTIGSASATNTANFDFDEADAGLVTNVNLEVRGTLNLARVEAGSAARTYTVTGTGNAALVTDDVITSFNASAAQGNIDITFQGVSEVAAVGGAGSDTFRFGTTISNSDSVTGGDGTDTVTLSIGGFSRNLSTTGVEVASVTFNDAAGGALSMSAASVATINLVAGSASADASVSQIASNATVNIGAAANGLDEVTLDGISGAAALTINLGTSSGTLNISGLTVTDVAAVTINNVANTTGTNVIASATFDADVKALTIQTNGGDAGLAVTSLTTLGGVTSLTVLTNGSAEFTLNSAIDAATALTNVTLVASGTGSDITMNDLGSGIGLSTITIDSNAGGDVFASAVTFGNSASATVGVYTITVDMETNGNVGTAAAAGSGIIVTTTGAASVNINVSAQASSNVHIGDLTLLQGDIATASAAGGTLMFSAGSIGNNAIVRFEEVNSSATFTGTQLVLGAVTLGVSAELALWSGGVAASGVSDFDVAGLTLTLGQSAFAEIAKGSGIETTAGSVGAINITADQGASATFGAIAASSLGSVTLSLASGASANFGTISLIGAASGNMGSIEVGGSDGAGVTFGTITVSALGAMAFSGALDVTFGAIAAATVGTINGTNLGVSGTLTIDLSGVSNAAEVNLGAATNVIISGSGNDVITLLRSSSGNDSIQYVTALAGVDNIINFFAGTTGADQIELDVSAFASGIDDSDGSGLDAAADIVFGTASGAATTLGASANLILMSTAYVTTANMLSAMATSLTLSTATLVSGTFLVAWHDNSDTYVSLVSFEEGASATDGIATFASASGVSIATLAQLQGITAGQLVAANFDIV